MWSIIELSIEPKSGTGRKQLDLALSEMAAEDPSFRVSTDHESGRIILGGNDEGHLDAKVGALRDVYKVEVNVGAPQVAYRETLGRRADIDYAYKSQTGGSGQFARIKIAFEPGEPGSGFQFESKIVDGAVPEEFISSIENGLEQAKENGLLGGFPVIDVRATLIGGAYHDLDSSALAFESAARAAFRELREKGAPKLLEPIMKVEVVTPDEHLGEVIGDLNLRRGQIEGTENRGNVQAVTALVPLANMFAYAPTLRHMCEGLAQFTMQYDHYEVVPLTQPTPPDDRYLSDIGMRA